MNEKIISRYAEQDLLENHLKVLHNKYFKKISLHEFDIRYIAFIKYWKRESLINFENLILKRIVNNEL